MENIQRLQKIHKAGSINIPLRKEIFGKMVETRQGYNAGDSKTGHHTADEVTASADTYGTTWT